MARTPLPVQSTSINVVPECSLVKSALVLGSMYRFAGETGSWQMGLGGSNLIMDGSSEWQINGQDIVHR